jgi:alpha-D-ribose 1-methylphosphonate 5-triphosphate synthase subunit PhnL
MRTPKMKIKKKILLVRNLKKTFTMHLLASLKVEALNGLSFELEEGDFGVLVGPSGVGKSTVLQCIFRTYKPSSGEILYLTREGQWVDLARCEERNVLELRRDEISYVTQFLHCPPRVPAEFVVAAPCVLQGRPVDQAVGEAREMLRRLRVPEKLWKAYPMTFSGGERQRVNLARAFISKPKLLLMDEPTASLDAKAIESVIEVLEDMKKENTTVLAVFHDKGPIEPLVTRVVPLVPKSAEEKPYEGLCAPRSYGQGVWR